MKTHRCTFEWDEPTKKDGRGDMQYSRKICCRPMHHEGKHEAEDGTQKERFEKP